MSQLVEYLVYGVLIGTTYGLVALPISLVYATTHSVDAAVGGHAVVAGAVAGAVGGALGIVVGIAAGVATSALVAALFVTLRARNVADPITIVLVTFGVAAGLESLVLWRHGRDAVISSVFDTFWRVGDIRINPQSAVNLAIGLGLMLLLLVLLDKTPIGRSLRACADNPTGAGLAGIAVARLQFVTILVGGFLAAVAGVLLIYTIGLTYDSGLHLTLSAIGAAMIFGFRGPVFSFAGGLVFGIVESLVGGYTSGQLASAIPFAFILVVLSVGKVQSAGVRP